MEAALAVAALGDSQSLYLDSDPLQEQTSNGNDLLNMESQNTVYHGANSDQQNVFAHTSEQHHMIASQQSLYSQGQLPQYDSSNTQPAGTGVLQNVPENGCIPNSKDQEQLQPVADSVHNEASNEPQQESPVIDIIINNVVCSFSTRCHLNLKRIALEGANVIYKKESGMVSMKIRHPGTTASIWSSGKITCTGATSEDEAKTAARKFARYLQCLGFNVRFGNYRVVNVLGTCSFPFPINITNFSRDHRGQASYEPELHPGVTYKIPSPKATLKIFSTGSITVTAPCVANVQSAIEHIFPLVLPYRMERKVNTSEAKLHLMPAKRTYNNTKSKSVRKPKDFEYESDDGMTMDDSDEDFESDESQD